MPSFNRNSNRFGKRDFGNRGFDGGRGDDRPQMYEAVCSDCGNTCEVPFRPNGKKPVFCRTCFKRKDDSDFGNDYAMPRNDYAMPRSEEPRFEKEQNAILNAKLDTLGYKLDQVLQALAGLSLKENPVQEAPVAKPRKKAKKA